jgi:predicted dehydrogenase
MGRNHVRVLRELGEVDLVGVADANLDAAIQVAAVHGTRGYGSHQELFEREHPDAIIVAAPTHNHHAVVIDAFAAGCHVLVEKPIAATLHEADLGPSAKPRCRRRTSSATTQPLSS